MSDIKGNHFKRGKLNELSGRWLTLPVNECMILNW